LKASKERVVRSLISPYGVQDLGELRAASARSAVKVFFACSAFFAVKDSLLSTILLRKRNPHK
jgi:hypothetical protein